MLPDKIIFRIFEGCSSFSRGAPVLAKDINWHFKQQLIVFEISTSLITRNVSFEPSLLSSIYPKV